MEETKVCEHKVVKESPITGDQLNPKLICIKCGEKANIPLYDLERFCEGLRIIK